VTFIGHTGEPRAVVKMFDIPVVTWVIYVYGNVSTMGRILYIYLCTHKIKSIGQKISTIRYNGRHLGLTCTCVHKATSGPSES
jgi:hypothetical protein